MLLWLSPLLLLLLLSTLLLRCLRIALEWGRGLLDALLRLRLTRRLLLLLLGLLNALLRLLGTPLLALLFRLRLRFWLVALRLLLGLRRALLLLRLCLLPVSLRLPPALLLFVFVVELRVSGYDQCGKHANCSRSRSAWESHVMNSSGSLTKARGVPSGTRHSESKHAFRGTIRTWKDSGGTLSTGRLTSA